MKNVLRQKKIVVGKMHNNLNSENISLNIFNKDDIDLKETISSLMTQSLIIEYGNPPDDQYIKFLLDYYYSREDSVIYYLLDNNEFAGFTWFITSQDPVTAKTFICVLYLYVDEKFRGKSYSKKLMNSVKEYAKSVEIDELRLAVRVENTKAINIYTELGYKFYKHEMVLHT